MLAQVREERVRRPLQTATELRGKLIFIALHHRRRQAQGALEGQERRPFLCRRLDAQELEIFDQRLQRELAKFGLEKRQAEEELFCFL